MNNYINKNFWTIKKSEEFVNMPKKFNKDFPELDAKDIKANLDSLLFLDLNRRDDDELLDERKRTIVRKNVKRNYNAQLLNERGVYRHKDKKTGRRVWVQRSFAYADPIDSTVEDVAYRKKREDAELRGELKAQLTPKEWRYLLAIDSAEDGKEMAQLIGVSEDYARKIKERLSKKVKKIMVKIRQEDVQQAC